MDKVVTGGPDTFSVASNISNRDQKRIEQKRYEYIKESTALIHALRENEFTIERVQEVTRKVIRLAMDVGGDLDQDLAATLVEIGLLLYEQGGEDWSLVSVSEDLDVAWLSPKVLHRLLCNAITSWVEEGVGPKKAESIIFLCNQLSAFLPEEHAYHELTLSVLGALHCEKRLKRLIQQVLWNDKNVQPLFGPCVGGGDLEAIDHPHVQWIKRLVQPDVSQLVRRLFSAEFMRSVDRDSRESASALFEQHGFTAQFLSFLLQHEPESSDLMVAIQLWALRRLDCQAREAALPWNEQRKLTQQFGQLFGVNRSWSNVAYRVLAKAASRSDVSGAAWMKSFYCFLELGCWSSLRNLDASAKQLRMLVHFGSCLKRVKCLKCDWALFVFDELLGTDPIATLDELLTWQEKKFSDTHGRATLFADLLSCHLQFSPSLALRQLPACSRLVEAVVSQALKERSLSNLRGILSALENVEIQVDARAEFGYRYLHLSVQQALQGWDRAFQVLRQTCKLDTAKASWRIRFSLTQALQAALECMERSKVIDESARARKTRRVLRSDCLAALNVLRQSSQLRPDDDMELH